MEVLLSTYNSIIAKTGYGLQSSHNLLRAGATWADLHALTDAGLIRIERWEDVPGTTRCFPIYRCFFP